MPALSNCVVINGNNAYTVTTSESPGLAINTISSISGNQNLFGYSHTAPMTAPYRVAALLQWTSFGGSNDGNSAVFFGYIDTSGKYSVTLFNNSPQIFAGSRYLNSNTLSNTLATYSMESWPELAWFGLRNDGANIHYEMSSDGVNFVSLAQESLGSAFLVNYTNIIWGFQTNNTNPISLTLRCYDPNGLTRAFPY